jgi:hypothetical protein
MTVNDVISCIRPYTGKINIQYVDEEIMNQLSYEASSRRFQDLGFVFTGSIEKNIAETTNLLRGAGGPS